jgi:purine-binding chemotaxis protein CheW
MSELKQYVSFLLSGERYAINIMDVEEIIRFTEITPVPKAPDFVEGIINLRERVIPVVDLKKRINMGESEANDNTRIIVINLNQKRIGLIIDEVDEIVRIESDKIDAAPAVTVNLDSSYIEGVAKTDKGMIIILRVLNIFSVSEQGQLNFM